MKIGIVSDVSGQSDWDAHFGSVIDGQDRRAAGTGGTQWPVNLLVKARCSGAAKDSFLYLQSLISSPNLMSSPPSKGDACVVTA